MPEQPSPHPHPRAPANNVVIAGVLVIVLGGLILWAGSSISNASLSVVELKSGQRSLIKAIDRLTAQVTASLKKVDDLETIVESERDRQNRLWDRLWDREDREQENNP